MPFPNRRRAALTIALLLSPVIVSCSSGDGAEQATGADPTSTTRPTTAPARAPASTRKRDVAVARKLDGPITGGRYGVPYSGMPPGWEEKYGYTENEYFISGEALSYASDGPLAADGAWAARPTGEKAPYATRMIVRRPARAADFNGTVVVEWLNVTAGRDSDPEFGFLADELLAEGYAYVGVSAQQVGVEPGGLGLDVPGAPPEALAPLKEWDPERYGELSHPGDAWSYDIFGQAARTAIQPGKGAPLGDLRVDHVIAMGESQSATRMVTYVNAIQPVTDMFDGFLIQGRGANGSPLGDGPDQAGPATVAIRADNDTPVLQLEGETDLEFLGYADARQDDAAHLVTWEIAGGAHADQSTLDYAVQAARRWTDADIDLSATCGAVNDGPQQPVSQAGFAALHRWVIEGDRPPKAEPIETDAAGAIVRDQDGLAKGGIRTPAVDAPTMALTGKSPSPEIICVLFGSQTPLPPQRLVELYGDTDGLVAAVQASGDRAVKAGFLLPRHAKAMVEEASKVPIG